MSYFSELHHYSPLLGCEAVRLSMVDARGGEFYRIVPRATSGAGWREARDTALDVIAEAIADGREPGEVGDAEAV